MSSKPATVHRVLALVLSLCVDLGLFYAAELPVTRSVFGHFTRVWFSAALRFLALTAVTLLVLGDVKPLLVRFITTYCLLPAVFGTGAKVLHHEDAHCGQVADLRCWLLVAAASVAAALFWEITAPDTDETTNGKEKKHKSRVLFMRVLRLFRPDYPLLVCGFVFLSLAVICK